MKSIKIIILLVVTSIVSSLVTYCFCNQRLNISNKTGTAIPSQTQITHSNQCTYKIGRLKGYKFIRPIQYAEPECEAPEYSSLKEQIQDRIKSYITSNNLISASVYLRDFDKGNWINVNPDEKYHPASLLKLGLLVTFLRMEEKNPVFLNKRITFTEKLKTTKVQTFNSKQIQVGKSYTIKELLEYMVSYSDNNATNLLHDELDVEEHKRTYEYLGIPIPDVYKVGYTISAKDYSTFLKALYNGVYLTHEHSEFAFELLTKTDFKDGLVAGLPAGTLIAHKFGEWTDEKSIHQLHESGIIYLNGKAYLLTIMTNGNNIQNLTEVISNITKIVFDNLENSNPSPTSEQSNS